MVMKNEINHYINKKCYDCCHFKKQNMELYKLNLPNDIVNNIIRYNCYEKECRHCFNWRCYQEMFYCVCQLNILNKRNVEEDILAFITVYHEHLPPLIYVKQFIRISEKRYEVLEGILWMLAHKDVEDVKEHIKLFIESKKLNVKNTIRDLNIFIKLTYEFNKKINNKHQLNYYPEIKLW